MKTSIEVEFWVIERDGTLTDPGDLAALSPQVEEEFVDCLFEIKTTPSESVEELRGEFIGLLEKTLSAANDREKALVPLGTPINGDEIDRFSEERARIQEAVLGEDFDYAKHCAGTHLHFEKRNVVDQLNTLIALDPALALLNSSPYYKGRRVAAGARPYIYRKKGYAKFPEHGQLWNYVDSVAEWDDRLAQRYVEFKRAALDAGIDERAFKTHFTPDDTIWTPVRLRKSYPTVEWRSPDATLPSQILRLAEEMYDVMERTNEGLTVDGRFGLLTDGGVTLPEFESVREHTDAAIHEGLASRSVRSYLDRMGFDVSAYDPLTERIDGEPRVSRSRACELRVEYARMLEHDVKRLAKAELNA